MEKWHSQESITIIIVRMDLAVSAWPENSMEEKKRSTY